jgi:PAS domain S-box-containing protein
MALPMGQTSSPRQFAAFTLLFAVYVFAGKLGLSLAFLHASATPVWPPTGIALAAFLILGHRAWPAVFLGAFTVNVTTAGSWLTSLGIAIGNTLEGMLGAYLVNGLAGGRHAFDRAQDVFKFAALAGMVSTTVSATIGVTVLSVAGYASWAEYGPIWVTWWLGDAAGAVVVAPVLVLWSTMPSLRWKRPQLIEAACLLLSIVLVGQVVFGGLAPLGMKNYPVAFLSIPFLIWSAFRFGQRGAATAIVVLSGTAVWGTLGGFGPFAVGTPNESLLLLQAFMGTISVMTISVAAAVSGRRRAEEALHESEIAYRQMFVSNPHPMWIIDRKSLVFLEVNQAAVDKYGYTRDEFQRMTLRDIRLVEDIPRMEEAGRALNRGAKVLGTYRHRKRDGTLIDVEISAHPLQFMGRPAALVLAYDVTERKQAEEERQRLLAREQAARAEAEAANRAKDAFLATLSHELRTPLTTMLGWARMLRTTELTAEQQSHAYETIERNTRVQAQLINDLLDVSGIVAGKVTLDKYPVDLVPIIENALESVRHAARAKAIRVETTLDHFAGPVLGDPLRLQQVVVNLLSNAIKFTPEAGRIELRLERTDASARLAVQDTGKGIAPELLPHIFDRFRQGDSSTTRAHGGLGLGLTIVRELVQLHGGTVAATSPGEGRGATFMVHLPLATAGNGPGPRAGRPGWPSAEHALRPHSLQGLRILVVDDDPDTVDLLCAALGHAGGGAEVTTAQSVTEALEAVEQMRPDVIVSDLSMPGQDGYALVREVKKLAGVHHVLMPVVAISAHARAEERQKALAAGFARYVAKPIDPIELARIVDEVARGQKTAQGKAGQSARPESTGSEH